MKYIYPSKLSNLSWDQLARIYAILNTEFLHRLEINVDKLDDSELEEQIQLFYAELHSRNPGLIK